MAVLPNVPADRISASAHKTDYKQVALTILAGILFILGWLPGRLFLGLRIIATWAAHTWVGSAVRVGWADGYKPRHSKR